MFNKFFIACECGSAKDFIHCCFKSKAGQTPEPTKIKVLEAVANTFYNFGEKRGELCLYSSLLIRDLLKEFSNTKSHIILGSAIWKNYPEYFDWEKSRGTVIHYHSWILTEYSEIVDLTCDALDERDDAKDSLATKRGIAPPGRCWEKLELINDRSYIGKQIGLKDIDFDYISYEKPKELCFRIYSRYLKSEQI